MKRMRLDDIKISSFVTAMETRVSATVRGGIIIDNKEEDDQEDKFGALTDYRCPFTGI